MASPIATRNRSAPTGSGGTARAQRAIGLGSGSGTAPLRPSCTRSGERLRPATLTKTEAFRKQVKGWGFPGEVGYPALTFTTDAASEQPRWCAWQVHKDGVRPLDVEVVREDADMFTGLDDSWPLDTLEQARVLVIGVGSIGSAAAEALQEYGIRRFALLDPDRLRVRNLARHRLSERDLGRFKVNAMAELMRARDRDAVIAPLTLDVVDHADVVRGILPEIDAMVVCSDGVESRQVAKRPGVLGRHASRIRVCPS